MLTVHHWLGWRLSPSRDSVCLAAHLLLVCQEGDSHHLACPLYFLCCIFASFHPDNLLTQE